MPIYEYQCLACGHRHEQIQRLDDLPLSVCPDCGGALKKLVSSPAFQFKGTGWYATDYATKKGAGPDGPRSSAKGDGDQSAGPSSGTSSEKHSERSSEKNSEKSSEKSSEKTSEKSSAPKPGSDSKSNEAAQTSTKREAPKAADS